MKTALLKGLVSHEQSPNNERKCGMIYLQDDPKEWAEKYGIATHSEPCPKCKTALVFDKPFAMKAYRCLETSPCSSCGFVSGIFRVVPVGEKELEIFNSLRSLK